MSVRDIRPLTKLSPSDIDHLRMLRWKARTDLGFLCREILNYKDVSDEIHGPFMNKLQKFPVPTPEQFKENDKVVSGKWSYKPIQRHTSLPGGRKVLILDPRGWLKTTINAQSHTIQWLLNYPDIAIMIIQSNLEKAEMILGEIKQHFQYNAIFRQLFPEHCPVRAIESFGTKGKFTTLARNRGLTRKEESVSTSSIDAGSSGIHVDVIKYSDIVEPSNVGTPEQMEKVTQGFYMSQNLLVGPKYWIDVEGTRYDFCLDGETPITMSDWNQKPIKDIKINDEVVGWALTNGTRYLQRSKVTACGSYVRETNKYTFKSGREVICTPDHKWWKGKGWSKGPLSNEYATLGAGHKNKNMIALRSLLVPTKKDLSWESGWLSGIFDGEGNVRKNQFHPSGSISICQTMHNPGVCQKIRDVLTTLNFKFGESVWSYKDKPKYEEFAHYEDKHNFTIEGGWSERYRFLIEIDPTRKEKLIETLFAQLFTEEDRLVSVEPAGLRTVYWFECETGNYIANGYCSKNSDTYGQIIKLDKETPDDKKDWKIHARGCYKKDTGGKIETFRPEELILPDLVIDGKKQLHWNDEERGLTLDHYAMKEREDPYLFSCQQKNSPAGGIDGRSIFPVEPGKYPALITRKDFRQNVRISHYVATVDTAETIGKRSNYTAITVAAFASDGRVYINEIIHGKFLPDETCALICNLNSLTRNQTKDGSPSGLPLYGSKLAEIHIEETGFARGLNVALNMYQHLTGNFLPIKTIKRDNQAAKIERIQSTLQPYYRDKKLIFLDDIKCMDHLLDELRQFPRSQSDDILDTLADLFQLKTWFGREIAKPTFEQHRSDMWDRMLGIGDIDKVTGEGIDGFYSKTGGL